MSSTIYEDEDVSRWSAEEVAARLGGGGEELFGEEEELLGQQEKVSRETTRTLLAHGVDGAQLLQLSEEQLVGMGVKSKAERRKVLGLVARLAALNKSKPQTGAVRAVKEDGFGRCEAHKGAALDLYCEECGLPVCAKCAAPEKHRGHKMVPSAQRGEEAARELEGLGAQLEEQSEHIEKVVRECGEAMGKLARATALSIEEILGTRDKLVKALHEASEAAIGQVNELEASKMQYLTHTVETNLALKKKLDSLRADLAHHLKESGQALVLQLSGGLKGEYEKLIKEVKGKARLERMSA